MTNQNLRLRYLVKLAVLTAVMLLFAFTSLTSIKIGLVEITPMVIPVAIGAVALGPGAGAFLGAVFGVTSFLQCLGIPLLSPFGSILFGIQPLFTALLCLVPRILMGFLAGLIFKATMKNGKPSLWKFGLGTVSAPVFNTLFFVGGFVALFSQTDFFQGMQTDLGGGYLLPFLAAFVGTNGLIEIAITALVALPVARVLYTGNHLRTQAE